MSLPTVDDLKIHANIPASDTSHDAELTDMLDAAIELVEGIVGPVGVGTVTETHYNVSSSALVLARFPASAVTAVGTRSGATTTPLTLADYELDTGTGILRRADGGGFYGSYTVTYSTGRATVPASIHLAILIVAAHLWETQRGTAPTALQLQDPNGADVGPSGMGYAIPRRAQELLQPYMLPVIA